MKQTYNLFRKLKSIILFFSFVFIYQVASAQGDPSADWTEKIQLYGHGFSVPTDFTDAEYDIIANTYKIFTVEKRHAYNTYGGSPSTERATVGTAVKLKAINPDIEVLLYWNAVMNYDGLYEYNAEFTAHPEWIHSIWPTGYEIYDLENIDCQDWWVNSICEIIEDGNLDGVFLDAGPKVEASGLSVAWCTAIDRVRARLDNDKIVIYNGYRVASSTSIAAAQDISDHTSGVYIEFFLYPPLDTKEEAALLFDNLTDAYNDGKIIVPRGGPSSYLPGTATVDQFEFTFASFLLFYGPNSYYIYNDGYDVSEGMLDYYPEYYDLATGASLGSPQRNGWVYTREFENYTITVDLENLTSSIEERTTPLVPVTGISVSPSSVTLTSVGATQSLSATVSPSDATNQGTSWSSSNTSVATVNTNGVVMAVANGNATITATADDGAYTDNTSIVVNVSGDDIIHEIGLIQAEEYNDMSGIQTETTEDTDGGLDVGYIGAGDWMEYEVNVTSAGTYIVDYRVASLNGGGSVEFQVEGSTEASTSIAATGGWQVWTTLSTSVSLSAGVQTIRLYASTGGWNINWFELTLEGGTNPPVDGENLALSGIASQSSNYSSTDGLANLAIDGNTDGAWAGGSVTHTTAEANAWWEVDLGSSKSIGDIVIYGRTDDCCKDRLSDFTVTVTTGADITNFTQVVADYPDPSASINAGGAMGRYIRIELNGSSALSLAEVEVYSGDVAVECATFTRIEGEDYDDMSGVATAACADTDGGLDVVSINPGDWCMYSDIDLTCATSVSARLASLRIGGNIEVRIDALDGTLIGTISQETTGGWQTWVTASTSITEVSGVHDVYLVFTDGSVTLFNFNWLEFSDVELRNDIITELNHKVDNSFDLYPNPATNELNIELSGFETAQMSILNNAGQTVIYDQFKNRINAVDISTLPAGMYVVKVTNNNESLISKFIKR